MVFQKLWNAMNCFHMNITVDFPTVNMSKKMDFSNVKNVSTIIH